MIQLNRFKHNFDSLQNVFKFIYIGLLLTWALSNSCNHDIFCTFCCELNDIKPLGPTMDSQQIYFDMFNLSKNFLCSKTQCHLVHMISHWYQITKYWLRIWKSYHFEVGLCKLLINVLLPPSMKTASIRKNINL